MSMNPDLQRRVQRYGWDKASAFYESFWQQQLAPAHKKLFSMMELREGMNVLDIACGSGQVSFPVAKEIGHSGHLHGTDLSDNMVQLASAKSESLGYTNTSFKQMDAENITFDDNSFDLVFSSLGLMYFPDPMRSFSEMYRVLKPGGQLGITVWGERKNCGWAAVFEIVDRRVVSEVCPMFFQYGNRKVMETALTTSGFNNLNIETINTILHYNSDGDACGAAFAGGPVALAYDKFSDEVKNEVHLEYLESIKDYKTADGYNIPGEFQIVTCNKP